MKAPRFIYLLLCGLTMTLGVQSQDTSLKQAYTVHEDFVKPSMASQYESFVKNFASQLEKHDIVAMKFLAMMSEDFRYSYIQPIRNMADLDQDPMAAVAEKLGKEVLDKFMDGMAQCYDRHGDYIVWLDPALSYSPDGIDINPDGEYYRQLRYFYVPPKNEQAFVDIARKIKDLHARKKISANYRIYRSGFGNRDNFFMVALAGENPAAIEAQLEDKRQLLGAEFENLIRQALSLTVKFEIQRGWMRPDLSYTGPRYTAAR